MTSRFVRGLKALTLNTFEREERQSWEIGNAGKSWDGWDMSGPMGLTGDEQIEADFPVLIDKAYKSSGPIFACMLARQLLFSEARFQWRDRKDGKPGELYGNQELSLLESPWPGGNTSNMLARVESDASIAGNSYMTTVDDLGRMGKSSRGGPNRRLTRMRPDWVTIVVGVPNTPEDPRPWHLAARIIAYVYDPPLWATGRSFPASDDMAVLLPEEVSHYSPIPDPAARWRGMSWLTPIIEEIESDIAATRHKRRFFKHGASPALSVSFDKDLSVEDFEEFNEKFNQKHAGADNAFRPYFLLGADVKPMTFSLRDLDYKVVQGAGETRIAAAARVPPVIAGLSEGLGATSYATYAAAKRHFADGWARPAWRDVAGSLVTLLDKPNPLAELWYSDAEISFLRDDAKDRAEIETAKASTLNALVTAGWTTDSALAFIRSGDWSQLKHSGLMSVQLQAPGTQNPGTANPAGPNPDNPDSLPPGVRRIAPNPANGAANNG